MAQRPSSYYFNLRINEPVKHTLTAKPTGGEGDEGMLLILSINDCDPRGSKAEWCESTRGLSAAVSISKSFSWLCQVALWDLVCLVSHRMDRRHARFDERGVEPNRFCRNATEGSSVSRRLRASKTVFLSTTSRLRKHFASADLWNYCWGVLIKRMHNLTPHGGTAVMSFLWLVNYFND